MHGQLRDSNRLRSASAPLGAHLDYFGGRVVANMQVVVVLYGAGNYLPEVGGDTSPSMASFYSGVLASPYVDWLSEYDTINVRGGTGQVIGRGTFSQQVTIAPSDANNGSVIDDASVQAEIAAQIQAGNLPAPTRDALGNNNTYYAIFFPHGKVVTIQGANSCAVFCAYHGTVASIPNVGEVYYGVHPDMQPGSGCEFGCGAAPTAFGNYTQVASHEMVETITDPEVGLATNLGPPLAWYDPRLNQEISDLCVGQNGQVVGGDGTTYDVQTAFSNSQNDCIVTGPRVNPIIVDADVKTCATAPASASVTLLGGPQGFDGDVTLSLSSVSPQPPTGGEITATFDPNPVVRPMPAGSRATMHIQASAATPAGTYTLTVQGASPGVTATASMTFSVFAAAPIAAAPSSPPNGADAVSLAPTFTWTTAPQATAYTLEILDGATCQGAPVRSYRTGNTSFTVPANDLLAPFHSYSWRATSANACGPGPVSSCFSFRSESCAAGEAVSNGGFEQGLDGWSIDSAQPPPLVSSEQPHGGRQALRLGNVTGIPARGGDSVASQTISLPAGPASTSLVFWMWGFSNDPFQFDQQFVRVTPVTPSGAPVTLLAVNDRAQAYERREIDLSPFAGQTIRLSFGVTQFGFAGGTTGMFVDDVSVAIQNCGPPDFAVRVAAAANPAEVCAGSAVTFGVGVDSVHGANFSSPVTLGTAGLPSGASATFDRNPILPGETTTLTLHTTRPTITNTYAFQVTGAAVNPPPSGLRSASASVLIDENPPDAPGLISPRDGDVNLPRRPTLDWTQPFVRDVPRVVASSSSTPSPGFRAPGAISTPPMPSPPAPSDGPTLGNATFGPTPTPLSPAGFAASSSPVPFAFGASGYHLQVARDAAFTQLVVDADVVGNTFTLQADLDVAREYFWRVKASNACGGGPYSKTGRFLVGACSEGWSAANSIPEADGVGLSTVIASPTTGKLYVIGGGLGFSAAPSDHVWAYDPTTGSWSRKTDVPPPGAGLTFGSGVELGGTIYVFGGFTTAPHRALWKYSIAADRWTRGSDLPTDNFGSAVAAIGGKIYLAYGSGFNQQTWRYDPGTDSYAQMADAPPVAQPFRLVGVALNGELHAVAGGFQGDSHVIYSPASNSWRTGPSLLAGVTNPAVGVIAGRLMVVGGHPLARTQIFDASANSWSDGVPIAAASNGVDNTAGAVLGNSFHVVGGFDGFNPISAHWQLHLCTGGDLSSATFLPLVVDGSGSSSSGLTNERTALLIDNVSGADMKATCVLYTPSGVIDSSMTVSVAANEVKTITDVIRAVRGKSTVQNLAGSLAIFGTEVFQATGSLVANDSGDSALEDGQPLAGRSAGFVPVIRSRDYKTQTVFSNLSSGTALLQLVAYPAEGGDSPIAASVLPLRPHATVSTLDIASQLGLPRGTTALLSWSANQPIAAVARDRVSNRSLSGFVPVRDAGHAGSSVMVPFAEDSTSFSTALELSNPGDITANVTVRFSDGTTGEVASRDLTVEVNSAIPIADVVRWALRSASATPSGKRGFLTVETPQVVTAQGRIIDLSSGDPVMTDQMTALASSFSPLVIRIEPFTGVQAKATLAVLGEGGEAGPSALAAKPPVTTTASRVAISNPNAQPAVVELAALNASGSAAGAPLVITIPAHAQFFTENLVASLGLSPLFLGSLTVRADSPVLVYNHRRTGNLGALVPIHGL